MPYRTHCQRGHEMTPENVMGTRRMCRECRNMRARHYFHAGTGGEGESFYHMTFAEIGLALGISAWWAERVCASALRKLRKADLTLFKEAVWLKRRAIDARPGNGAWTDVDAEY